MAFFLNIKKQNLGGVEIKAKSFFFFNLFFNSRRAKSFIKIFLWGLDPCLAKWVIQHQSFCLNSFSLNPSSNPMKNSLSIAEETEAQRDQVIYQIHGTLEAGFKPQCSDEMSLSKTWCQSF